MVFCGVVPSRGGCASVPAVQSFGQASDLSGKSKDISLWDGRAGVDVPPERGKRRHGQSLFLLAHFGPSGSFFPESSTSLSREDL